MSTCKVLEIVFNWIKSNMLFIFNKMRIFVENKQQL